MNMLWRTGLMPAILFSGILIACGDNLPKNYQLFDTSLEALRAAPTSLVSSTAGSVELLASAQELLQTAPDITSVHVDPVSGQLTISGRPSTTQRSVFLGAALVKRKIDAGFDLQSTEWVARTIWVLQGETFASTRDLQVKNGVIVALLDDPPLRKTLPTIMIVEFVSASNSTALIKADVVWM
ncbi:hypothetical protein GTP46_22970 [Duganella sp. FT135W]|uniref:Uncharacterized protein n=1 Tax=Duganella flavida TaxID=2692175 RepID=A0A6L8KFN2_9BURK|nr:hypothetical protein [Duganella flavida]MYM25497.1 hypothetical protein [Duganella flavida]